MRTLVLVNVRQKFRASYCGAVHAYCGQAPDKEERRKYWMKKSDSRAGKKPIPYSGDNLLEVILALLLKSDLVLKATRILRSNYVQISHLLLQYMVDFRLPRLLQGNSVGKPPRFLLLAFHVVEKSVNTLPKP